MSKELEIVKSSETLEDEANRKDRERRANWGPESESARMFAMVERMATDPTVEPAKLREILSVKQNWEADEARKAFAMDMASFQSRCPIISKADDAYGKMYARIDRIHRETRELRKECGFWFVWSKCVIKDSIANLEGLLGHRRGHTMPLAQTIPLPDVLKGQNATQRAGAAMTYAKRYGECLALDIVTGEDTDGGPGNPKPIIDASQPVDNSEVVRELAKELWNLLKTLKIITGAERNWQGANNWLWREEILDAAADEAAPQLSADRFKSVIEAVKRKAV